MLTKWRNSIWYGYITKLPAKQNSIPMFEQSTLVLYLPNKDLYQQINSSALQLISNHQTWSKQEQTTISCFYFKKSSGTIMEQVQLRKIEAFALTRERVYTN